LRLSAFETESFGLKFLFAAIYPSFNAVSAYLHHQSFGFKSLNFHSQVSSGLIHARFNITFNISLLEIKEFKLYALGLDELFTIIHASAKI